MTLPENVSPSQGLSVLLCWLPSRKVKTLSPKKNNGRVGFTETQCIIYLLRVISRWSTEGSAIFSPFFMITLSQHHQKAGQIFHQHLTSTTTLEGQPKGGCSREAARSHEFWVGLWSSPFSCLHNTLSTDKVHPALKTGLGSSLFCSHEISLQRDRCLGCSMEMTTNGHGM